MTGPATGATLAVVVAPSFVLAEVGPSAVAGPGGLAWWWVALILAAGSALLVWSAVRYRLAAVRRRAGELQDIVDLRTRELRSLARLTEKINTAVRLDDVLEHVWTSFRMVVPYNRIGFAEFDGERETVRAVWARSDASEIRINAGYEAPIASTSLGRILETATPRIIDDLVRYLDEHPGSAATRAVVAEGMRSSLTVPLEAMGHKVGFLFFSSQEPFAYGTEHIRVLESLSGQLSLAIEKSRLYDRLLDTTRQLEDANRRLEQAASTDGLTGLANRRVFDERLEIEWRRCRRIEQPLSLLMIDIDHFKRFNDLHGHVAGDRCLRAVADTLSSTITRAADLVARYGGEEFGAILPDTENESASRLAEDLRQRIQDLCLDEVNAGITISVGVATCTPTVGRSTDDLVRRADASLYVAKQEGRNVVRTSSGLEDSEGPLDPEG